MSDYYLKDLNFNFFNSEIESDGANINSIENELLKDSPLFDSDYSSTGLKFSDNGISRLKDHFGNISINITKENTSFDFGEKFQEYLINSNFKDNANMISFMSSASSEIGKVIYERVQNFLNNYVNVDSCHYKSLVSKFSEYNIDIEEILTRTFPSKLEYLLNVFSIDKTYFKGSFFQTDMVDFSLDLSDVNETDGLTTYNTLLNQKYFGNFYENFVYPIVRNELYDNYDLDEDIQAYILSSTNAIYDECLTGTNNKYNFINLIRTTTSDFLLQKSSQYFKAQFDTYMRNYQSSIVYEMNEMYFYNLLQRVSISSTADMSAYITIDSSDSNINNIEVLTPNYENIFDLIETFFVTREEYIKLLRIKTCAQKIANICNSICKLREDIKVLRLKDAKLGTAALIEELITEFIFKNFTQKVGMLNLGKVPNNMYALSDFFASISDSDLRAALNDVKDKEQKSIGIKFEEHYKTLLALTSVLDCEVVEYLDTTPSYLNINPADSIEQQVSYKTSTTSYPPYLNINGLAIYANFDDKTELYFDDVNDIYQRSQPGDSDDERLYYVQSTTEVYDEETGETTSTTEVVQLFLNDLSQLEDSNGVIYYVPEDEYKFIKATNLNEAEYSEAYGWYGIKEEVEESEDDISTSQPGVSSIPGIPGVIIDLYDRRILHNTYKEILDGNSVVMMQWENGVYTTNEANRLILETTSGFMDYNSSYALVFEIDTTISDDSNDEDIEDQTEFSYGLWKDLDGTYYNTNIDIDGETTLNRTFETFITFSIETSGISYIASGCYLKYMAGIIIDTDVNYYTESSYSTFFLEGTEEEVGCTSENQLYDLTTGLILNNYASDTEVFYAIENYKTVVLDNTKTYTKDLYGNSKFWTDLSTLELYEGKTIKEEADIVKFYKKIGLIDDDLSDNYDDGGDTLSLTWMYAREKIINILKSIWESGAQHTWYNPLVDDERLSNKEITEEHLYGLQQMDILYHSNLGESMAKDSKKQVAASVINLENWENNTLAIHPFIWNLIEYTYDNYLETLTISLYGDEILDKIYKDVRTWNVNYFDAFEEDGSFSFDLSKTECHNLDYWKYYNKSLFPYSTEYETDFNQTYKDDELSRFLDFDGPFNFEALRTVINKYWTEVGVVEDNSIRLVNLSKYYVDSDL